jgi:glutathione peroxidase
MTEKVDVNGPGRHPVYDELVQAGAGVGEEGPHGDISWNFEKFLIDGSGSVVARFAPTVVPDDPRVVSAIELLLG